jgi:hypothetical protein
MEHHMIPKGNPEMLRKAAQYLKEGLDWGKTNEGYAYWEEVYNKLLYYADQIENPRIRTVEDAYAAIKNPSLFPKKKAAT